ncbi:MAG: FtsH protease activity modulator HflK [Rhodospirillaceae bacterium]|jgi:membrane protease subunit HflK|nr:FtsH protease activity modulator HflK [Rhodospirillales bacterium]MBT3905669.1 FtsH protease activity modulator HflK [Rhodospirillaceae bacterium]MBT4699848.1 FtsH protease activity modulator HflK [Rhodospirillaceae bacterium]MBT5036483.1 FtsH protease activity modulator HflK [Rhodospirillaceae bacterium]MBT6219503.1 FtsH protease activity modulator HflK [Rhodospirillaceae bacterium]
MAWTPQGGGQGPWGGGNGGGGGGRGPTGPGGQPPDIEEMLRRGQDKFKKAMPSGFGSGKGLALILLVLVGLWSFSGVYRVEPGVQGVELLFGRYVKQTGPGLHIWFPAPIGQVFTPNVDVTNTVAIGFRSQGESNHRAITRDVPVESLMLTGDQNIIDIDFVVQWRIKNAAEYLFNIRDPQATVKIVAESAIREVIGRTKLEDALTKERQQVESKTKALLQTILDEYKAGVAIAEVKLQKVDPPKEVIDAFNDVQRAKQDQERKINEAVAYSNDVVPRAKGEAAKMLQEAQAYKARVIDEATGEASRFLSVYNAYKGNKAVTKRRIYLERMQDVLKNSEKVIIDQGKGGGSGVVPYLPLPELKKRSEGKK